MELQQSDIVVELIVSPQQIEVGDKIEIFFEIKQNEQIISDADDVRIQIWKEGEEDQEKMFVATVNEENQHFVEFTLIENGKYDLMYHVIAKGKHVMDQVLLINSREGN